MAPSSSVRFLLSAVYRLQIAELSPTLLFSPANSDSRGRNIETVKGVRQQVRWIESGGSSPVPERLELPAVPTATQLLLDKRDSDLYLRFQLSRLFGSRPFLPNPSI